MASSSSDEDNRAATERLIWDTIFAVALVASGVFLLAWILLTPAGFGQASSSITFRTIPVICSSALSVLAAFHLAGRAIALAAAVKTQGGLQLRFGFPGIVFWRRAATIGALVTYVLALKAIPFLIATFALLVVMFAVYGQRSPWRIALVAALGSTALTGLFIHVLKLPI